MSKSKQLQAELQPEEALQVLRVWEAWVVPQPLVEATSLPQVQAAGEARAVSQAREATVFGAQVGRHTA